ncbi:MAG: hypothetical protein S4CHLAM81_12820 [Chlamydiales bacterium]|nr:hypothetical protein [Chlamydiales bacterium]MCH9636057.1 hypothetical protein [Chlamydiales bacterium]MCH9703993.1 GNAT family N-acetyltransferase [Chlamydiota bacterium]
MSIVEFCEAQDPFWYPLAQKGVKHYISNIQTKLLFLRVDQHLFPITINEKEYKNSYITSNYYSVKQIRLSLSKWIRPLTAVIALLYKGIQINRTVIINNQLLSNTLYPNLSSEQVQAVTRFLQQHFPTHLIMMRYINEADGLALLQRLRSSGYATFYSREILYYQPHKLEKKPAYHRRRDERLMQAESYYIGDSEDYAKLIWLYNRVYRDKHTGYCPHYSAEFLKHAVENQFLTLRAIYQNSELVGFFAYQIKEKRMTVPLVGYDIAAQNHRDTYRVLTTSILKEAENLNVSLNEGSGGETTKLFRGMKAHKEYAAIYFNHLPWARRLFWKVASLFSTS